MESGGTVSRLGGHGPQMPPLGAGPATEAMIFPWLEFKDILLTCVCDCEGLRDDRRANIIQLWEEEKKKRLESPKAFTVRWSPLEYS